MVKINLSKNEQYPILILGSAVLDFKKVYNDPIVQVSDMASLREVISYYAEIKTLDRILVIEDLSFLPKGSEGILLKFIEETELNVILLSYYDVVSPILLSRFKLIVKAQRENTVSMFLSVTEGSSKIEEACVDNTSYYDRVRFMGKFSPKVYYLDKMIGSTRNKSKILSVLE